MNSKIEPGKILASINSPNDLRKLNEDDLFLLCDEIRQFIIDVVSHHPGHLGASLGAVELAVAIHYVFNTPYDKLIWDVGHQAYAHKIITGRRDLFHTNRQYKGISGFPKMSESEYDAFGVGHSSTSISSTLGMAIASQINNEKDKLHIAVIGDGSMTGGMAFEALNHAGVSKANILIILNDNGIAIDKNVGALKEYLTDITTSKTYNKIKDKIWNILGQKGKYGYKARSFVQKIENTVKTTIFRQSNIFESLNFRYFGPVDGHDIFRLTKVLSDLKNIPGPKLLHCITTKGKGFEQAERDQVKYHAPGYFDKDTGKIFVNPNDKNTPPKFQEVFGKTIIELAKENEKIVGITPAMATGCSLNLMMKEFPKRTFDVGIAEQHAVTFSAGMAVQGLIPFCNIYSSFMQRAYDQIIHDVALQNLSVIFCLDRGGIVGEDGATHHGVYDLAFLRCIPNMIIASPMNEIELRNMMYTAQLRNQGPFTIRYPRGNGVLMDWQKPFEELPIGKGRLINEGNDLAILTIGPVGNFANEAISILKNEGYSIALYDLRFVKPIDHDLLMNVCKKFENIITIEDGTIIGGMGSAVIEFIADNGFKTNVKRLGVPDRFVEHGTQNQLYHECGYYIDDIIKTAKEVLTKKSIKQII
ncbi:MAG TPA: 1-deoxy-D-xylulose-5-phosphate synthase [Bacteroidales bacterium]|nr:1-deoxy-D-xylulose-5-phosphate synthase [Bacteroidales bacterium]